MKKELKGKKPKGNVNSSAASNNFKEEKRKIKKKIYFNSGKGVFPSQAYEGTVNTGANINANININSLHFGPVQGDEREALQQNLRVDPRAIGGDGPVHRFDQGGVINNGANKTRKGILQNVNISPRGKDKDGNYFTTNVDGGTNSFDVKNKKLNKNGSSGLGTDRKLYRGVGNLNEVNTGRVDNQSAFKGGDVVSLDGAAGGAVGGAAGAPSGDSFITSGSTFEGAGGTDNRKANHVRGNIRGGSNPAQRNCYRFNSGHYFANSPSKLNLAYTHKIYKNRTIFYSKKYFKSNKIVNNSMTGQVKKNEFNPVDNYNMSFVNNMGNKSLLDMNDPGKGEHSEDTYFEFSANGMNGVEGGRDDLGAFFDVGTSTRSCVLDTASCRGQQGGYSLYGAAAKSTGQEVSECGNCGRCESCNSRSSCSGFNLYSSATMNGISGREKREMGEPNFSGSNVEPVDTEQVEEMDQQMLSEKKKKEKEEFAQSYLEKIVKLLSDKVKRMLTVTDKECIHLVKSIIQLLQCVKKIINFSNQCHFHYSIFGIVLNIYAHVCVKIFAQNDILKVANLKCLVCMFEILIMLRRDSFNLSYAFFLFVNCLKNNIDGIDILTKKNLKYNTKVLNNDEKIFLKMLNSFVTLFSFCAESQSSMVRVESLKSFCCVLGMLKRKRWEEGTAQGGWEARKKAETGVEKGVGSDMGNQVGNHLGNTVIDKAKENPLGQSEPSDEHPSAVFSPFSKPLILGSLLGKKGTMFRGHTTGKMINLQKYYLSFFKSSYMCSEVYTRDGGEVGRRDPPNKESDQQRGGSQQGGASQQGGVSQPSYVKKNMGSKKENANLYKANVSSIPNQQWPKNNWNENAKDGNPNFTNDQVGSYRNVEEREYKTKNSILLTNFETIFNSDPRYSIYSLTCIKIKRSVKIQKNIVFFLNHIDVHIFSYVTYLVSKISHIIPINKSFFNKYISVLLKNLNKERRKFIFLMLSYSEYEKSGLYVVLNLLSNLCIYNFHYKTNIHFMDFESISDDSLRRNLGEENDCGGGTGDGVTGRGSGIRGGTGSSITDEYNTHPSLNPTNEDSFGEAKDYTNVNEHEVYLVDHMIHNNEEWCSVYAVLIVLSFKYPSLIFSFFFNKFGKGFVQNCDNCLPHFNLFDWSHRFGYYISSGVLNAALNGALNGALNDALEGETQVNAHMLNVIRSGGDEQEEKEKEEDHGGSPMSECSGTNEGGGKDGVVLTDNRRGEANETTKISSTTSQVNLLDTHFRAGRKQSLPCKEEVALELLTHQMYAFLEYPHCVQPSICDREWSFCYVYISSILNLFFNKNASFFGENCFFFKKNIWHLLHDRSNLKTHHFLEYLEMFKDSNFNYVSESSELMGMLNCVINPLEEGTKLGEKREEVSERLEDGVSIGRDLMAKWRQMNSNKDVVSCGDNTKDDPDGDLIHFKQPYMKYSRHISNMIEDHMASNLFFQIMVRDSYAPNDPPFAHYEEYLRQISVELIAARLIHQEKTGFTHLCCFHRGDTLLSDLFLGDDPFVETVTTCLEVPSSRQSVANQGELSNSSVGKERLSSLAQHPADGSPVGKDTTIDLSNTIEEERKVLDAIIKKNVKMEEQHRKDFVDLKSTLHWSIEEGDDQGIKQANNFRASENNCGEDKRENKIRPYSVSSYVEKLCGSGTEGGKGMERRVAEGRQILQRRNFSEFKFLKAKIKILHEGKKNGIPRREKIINFEKKFPEYFYHKKVININHKINKNFIKIYYLFSANYFYTTNISQIIHTIISKIYEENIFLFKALKDCFCSFPESGKNVWNNFEVKEKNFFDNFVCKAKKGRHVKAVDSMEQFNHVLVGVDQLLNGEDNKNASNTYSVNVLINKILKIILKHLKNTNFINYNKCLNFPFLFLSFFDIKIKLSFEMESFAFLEELDQGNFKNVLLNLPYHVRYFFGSLFLYIEYEDIFLVNTEKCQVRETTRPPSTSQYRRRRHSNNLTTYNFIVESILAEDYSLKNLKNMNKTNKKDTKNSLFAKRKKAKVEIPNVKNTSDFELEDKYLKVQNDNVGKEKKEKIKRRSGPFKKINKLNCHKIDVSEWNVKSFRCAGDSPRGYATPFRSTIIVEFKKTVQINFDCSSTLPVKCKINFCYYHFEDDAFCFFPLARTKHIYVHPSQ
ncbi:hypothetical protein PCYB_111130 [Plasmodium cynomolgi strain B]|uniref:Uncharacterized protein n=1 Tax=Plasmodium cynomolgi (strain B) TaxID=1120755 RepID=K6VD10_PLACD|nr:hypothetical protein PCYB_111130 [Plasmodium cynomolgi strain B]GAB67092.1 hypothetical protein PCYB_111130 [Plasmodium cynomolgi strain B]